MVTTAMLPSCANESCPWNFSWKYAARDTFLLLGLLNWERGQTRIKSTGKLVQKMRAADSQQLLFEYQDPAIPEASVPG